MNLNGALNADTLQVVVREESDPVFSSFSSRGKPLGFTVLFQAGVCVFPPGVFWLANENAQKFSSISQFLRAF